MGTVVYDPDEIVMDRRITCTEPVDDNNRSYVYYEDDDGTEYIAEMDHDVAEGLVQRWNEAVQEDLDIVDKMKYLYQRESTVDKENELLDERLRESRNTVRSYKALLQGRETKIKNYEKLVDAIFGCNTVSEILDACEDAGLAPHQRKHMKSHAEKGGDDTETVNLSDEMSLEEERREYPDRDAALENHWDQREHLKKM
ncbi:MAG: hypothetical protein ACW99G_11595 [Candidatus Thorarchaeota archaeon]|jgi:hypothetical protein